MRECERRLFNAAVSGLIWRLPNLWTAEWTDLCNGVLRKFDDATASKVIDRKYMEMAVEEARRSKPEDDGRVHPMVGAVVVKDGKVLAKAHRSELGKGDNAEYTALEKKLRSTPVAGTTVYTTLEPCTCRGPGKVSCAEQAD